MFRYSKAFQMEPSLHSGINTVVLLMAAGHEFDSSVELRKIGMFLNSKGWTILSLLLFVCLLPIIFISTLHLGLNIRTDYVSKWCLISLLLCIFSSSHRKGVTLSSLLGKKGSLEKMHDYWDVGFFLGAGILTNEHKKVIEASEKLYRLKAPLWWVPELMSL